ncbi:MAG: hypothetical protein C0606_03895 [Hyphomicrobiales bacterium]|nr:MAG: hypothetical protein C0606_03895 [Hyphomicrobiales bacterium]
MTMNTSTSAIAKDGVERLLSSLKTDLSDLIDHVRSTAEAEERAKPRQRIDEVLRDAFTGLAPADAATLATRLSVVLNSALVGSLSGLTGASSTAAPMSSVVRPKAVVMEKPFAQAGGTHRGAVTAATPEPSKAVEAVEEAPTTTDTIKSDPAERIEEAWRLVLGGEATSYILSRGLCSHQTVAVMRGVARHLGEEAHSLPWVEARSRKSEEDKPSDPEDSATAAPWEDDDTDPDEGEEASE